MGTQSTSSWGHITWLRHSQCSQDRPSDNHRGLRSCEKNTEVFQVQPGVQIMIWYQHQMGSFLWGRNKAFQIEVAPFPAGNQYLSTSDCQTHLHHYNGQAAALRAWKRMAEVAPQMFSRKPGVWFGWCPWRLWWFVWDSCLFSLQDSKTCLFVPSPFSSAMLEREVSIFSVIPSWVSSSFLIFPHSPRRQPEPHPKFLS